MSRAYVSLSIVAVLAAASVVHAAPGEPSAPPPGPQLYAQRCAACHGATAQGGGIGPALRGVVGRTAGRTPGYDYSAALKAANLKLDRVGLDGFLAAPTRRVPGTKMPIGVTSAADRAAIIRYLETLK